jgi:hypothetical protein
MNDEPKKTKFVEMVGPDVQMDQHGTSYEPANRLPTRCPHCSFPDLDFVPQPYLLTKGISSPSEISPAQMGNFLVRERVRCILEVVVPGACRFYPTTDKKSGETTDWFLAIPKTLLKLPRRQAGRPACPKCREPKTGYIFADHASYSEQLKEFDSRGIEVFKSHDWHSLGTAEDDWAEVNREREKSGITLESWKEHIHWAIPGLEPPPHPERWTRRHLGRDLFLSVRLEQLLKRAKVKGQLVRSYSFKEVQPSPYDESWVEEKLQLLQGKQSALKAAQPPPEAREWFKQFLKRNAAKSPGAADFSVEKTHRITLPQDYKDFITVVGPKSFAGVSGRKGSKAKVLLPQQINFNNYRRGKVPYLEGEQADVDGILFAELDNGDGFVFDLSTKDKDYPVYWHKHEDNELEAFAPDFAACIKRFSEKS